MFQWLIAILLFYVIAFITYKQRFSRIARMTVNIPGPRLVFLAGNAFEFGRNPVDFFNGMVQTVTAYGDVTRIWLGTSLHIFISGVKDVEFFLNSNSILKKAKLYDFLQDGWLGTAIVTADGGPKWQSHRKLLNPAFHIKILEEFIDVFNKNSNILIKKLKSEVGKPSFDIQPYVSNYVLDILCESVMGTAVNAQLDSNSEFVNSLKNVTTSVMHRIFKPWLFPKLLFDISPTGRLYRHSLKCVLNFVDQVIIKRKKILEKSKLEAQGDEIFADVYGQRKKYAFLDLMLQYRDAGSEIFTDVDVREEVNTFMFAGHDTTTSAISFALYALTQHSEIQEEVVKELKEIYGDSDREETFQDLQSMKYLERVIKESLRLYPPGPFIGRSLTKDVTIPSGYTLPEGSSVLLFLYKLHHNPETFPNPEKFDPDNFLPERMQNRSCFAYCPFSAGPRNCIGQKFAMLEIKSTLSSVLRKYKLFPCEFGPEVILSSEITLQSATGMHIRIEKRT